jgi:phosphoadenosine phosphosulfate reductase
VQSHEVPYNPLHERGYPSIGCVQCTRAVAGANVTEYTRLGRWDSTGKTECGLHSNGSGI